MEVIMTDQAIFKKDREYIVHTYQRFPVAVKCGHGARKPDIPRYSLAIPARKQHGSTFGGNPVVCAGGIEVLNQVCRKDFLSNVSSKAAYLKEKLLALPGVVEVSGLGLMIDVKITEGMDARLIASRCAEGGLMILTAKTKLRIMPPLNITMDEIDRGLDILCECLSGFGGSDEA